MDHQAKAELVARLISGTTYCTVHGETYKLLLPSRIVRYEAERLYSDMLYRYSFETDWLNKEKAKAVLIRQGVISLDIDKMISDSEKAQEDLKINLFENMFREGDTKIYRKTLDTVRGKYHEMLGKRHSLDYATVEGFCDLLKQHYLLVASVYTLDGQRVFEDFNTADFYLADNIIAESNLQRISISALRELSRTEPWRGYWNVGKSAVFDTPLLDLNDDQRMLLSYSRMYDSIYDHPSAPTDEVIENDDLIDGWMIKQQRARDKDRKTSEVESLIGGIHKDAQEMYVPVDNAAAAQRINDLNDTHGSIVKAQRAAVIRAKGQVNELDLPDMQQEMTMKATQMEGERIRNG